MLPDLYQNYQKRIKKFIFDVYNFTTKFFRWLTPL